MRNVMKVSELHKSEKEREHQEGLLGKYEVLRFVKLAQEGVGEAFRDSGIRVHSSYQRCGDKVRSVLREEANLGRQVRGKPMLGWMV